MSPACFCAILLSGVVAVSRPVLAQSLGDVARQEEERRKDVKSTSKVYTNKDLGTPRTSSGDSSDAPKASADPAAPAPGGSASKEAAKDDTPAKDPVLVVAYEATP